MLQTEWIRRSNAMNWWESLAQLAGDRPHLVRRSPPAAGPAAGVARGGDPGWAGPFPWFEFHLNQTNHPQKSFVDADRRAHRQQGGLRQQGTPAATRLSRREKLATVD
jgi:hypothetical protein